MTGRYRKGGGRKQRGSRGLTQRTASSGLRAPSGKLHAASRRPMLRESAFSSPRPQLKHFESMLTFSLLVRLAVVPKTKWTTPDARAVKEEGVANHLPAPEDEREQSIEPRSRAGPGGVW